MTHTSLRALNQFSRLVHPFDPDEFVEHTYEQRPLYIRRDDENYFAELLTTGEIERAFNSAAIAKSIIRMNKDGKEVPSDQFSERVDDVPIDRLANDRVLKLFEGGHTIIINSGNQLFPNLDRYCSELEGQLRFRVQPNIYITPSSAQAFDTHFDDHDVFILQIMGSKNWRVFHSAAELPSRRQRHVPGTTYTLQAPQLEMTLSPGDTLYLPRGVLHDASTDGMTSAHITLGFHPTCRFDLLQELTYLAQDTPAFRKAVPIGLMHDQDAAVREIKRLLTDFVDKADVDGLIERRYKSFVAHRRLDSRDRFRDLARLNRFNLNTVVRRRTSVLYTIERDERRLAISFSGNSISLQPFLESALDSILGDESFAVRDIQGLLSDKARLDLASTFLKAGLLEVVDLKAE